MGETSLEKSLEKDGSEVEELVQKYAALYESGRLKLPNKIFPPETVGRTYERAAKFLEAFPKNSPRKPYNLAIPLAKAFMDAFYSFTDNLRTGQYAPYPHEQTAFNMAGDNCTTIISDVYLFCEAVGLKPEIVQFFGFKDIKTKKDEEEAVSPSHYSLIIDVGRKHKYLFDPFYSIFGPVREQGEDYIKVGKCQGHPARKRMFAKMLPYTAQDFVEMMDRLHDPAESLDMLVAGQRVYRSRPITKTTDCDLMIYYDDGSNILSTRLYIPQKPLTDKAIYTRMALNDEGNITKLLLECYLAKDSGWDSLIDPKKVCETDFSTAYVLRRRLQCLRNQEGKRFLLKNEERIAPSLLQADERDKESLLSITEKLCQGLTGAERQKIYPLVLARTLYESELPSEKYLYTSEKHDARLLEFTKQEMESRIKIQPIKDLLWLRGWKLDKMDRNEARQARYAIRRHEEKISEAVKEINTLNHLRYSNKKGYSRAMDKVLFSETIKGYALDDLEKMVHGRNLDPRVGYLAMVADFIPFILEGQEDLELRLFRQPIQEKVTARRKKRIMDRKNTNVGLESVLEKRSAVIG